METDDVKAGLRMPNSGIDHAMEFAAAIVSETSTSVTCQYSYQNETAGWIASGHSLSDEYISSRSEVMLTQFIKAGVRLAQLLDSVATAYYRAERAGMPSVVPGAGAGSAAPTTRFPWDFDPEDYLYEVEDERMPAAVSGDSATPASRLETTTTAIPIVVRSPEEKRRMKRMKEKAREETKKRLFMGVDLDAVVLIKRGYKLLITYKHKVVDEMYVPRQGVRISVEFVGGAAASGSGEGQVVEFGLDADLLVGGPVSKELLSAIFRKLKGLPGGEVFESVDEGGFKTKLHGGVPNSIGAMHAEAVAHLASIGPRAAKVPNPFPTNDHTVSFESVSHMLKPPPTRAELRMRYGSEKLPSEDQRANELFASQEDRMVIINYGPIVLVSRDDLLLDRSITCWLFNTLTVYDVDSSKSTSHFVYMDARMFDFEPTTHILSSLAKISDRHVNRELMRKVIRARPPIIDAMKFLGQFFSSKVGVLRRTVAISELNTVYRPERKIAKMMEIVLRPQAEMEGMMELLNRFLAIPSVRAKLSE